MKIKDSRKFEYTPNVEQGIAMFNSMMEDYEEPKWTMLDTKQIHDTDGFLTDYSIWTDGKRFVAIYGDNDIYTPVSADFDMEFETEDEAINWLWHYETDYDDEDEADSLALESTDRTSRDTEYRLLQREYRKNTPKEFDADSAELADFLDDLRNHGQQYDIYQHKTDNRVTVFHEELWFKPTKEEVDNYTALLDDFMDTWEIPEDVEHALNRVIAIADEFAKSLTEDVEQEEAKDDTKCPQCGTLLVTDGDGKHCPKCDRVDEDYQDSLDGMMPVVDESLDYDDTF